MAGSSAQKDLEKVPPHDEAAEACVLGAMLTDPRAADVACEELDPSDFYLPRHKILFGVLSRLFQKDEFLDELYVVSELGRQGLLESIGGKEIIGRLINETPSAANIENYCKIVSDRAVERELIEGAGKILKLVHEPSGEPAQVLLETCEKLVYDIADRRSNEEASSMLDLMNNVLTQAEEVHSARLEGRELPSPALPTQYAELDRLLTGGLWPGELIIVAGRPGMGKTTFAINIARQVSITPHEAKRKASAIFSLEMPKEQVAKNIAAAEARIMTQKMRRLELDDDEYGVLKSAAAVMRNAPMYIDDTSALSISELRSRCRRLKHRQDIRLVVVDYLQLMRGTAGRKDNREQEVAEISRGLKGIARELEIPIIVLSQLNRSTDKRDEGDKRPQLSDLRESGAIEQDADIVIMLYREEYYDLEKSAQKANVGEALVLKNRNGPIGRVKMTFLKDILRFESYVPEHDVAAGD